MFTNGQRGTGCATLFCAGVVFRYALLSSPAATVAALFKPLAPTETGVGGQTTYKTVALYSQSSL